jgi:hypothetical protein
MQHLQKTQKKGGAASLEISEERKCGISRNHRRKEEQDL